MDLVLRAFGIAASSYEGLLSSVLMSKMAPEFWLVVSHELSEEEWEPESVMNPFRREIEAKEYEVEPRCFKQESNHPLSSLLQHYP